MRKSIHVLLVAVLLMFSSAFSQTATTGDAPTFKSQFAFLTYFAPSFANVKQSFLNSASAMFYPSINLSWRATFDYKQINIYTRMYIVGSSHNDSTGDANADGFYYRFDRGYVTYTPLDNLKIRWGLTTTGGELIGGDYIGENGTNSYADLLAGIFGGGRDLSVYFTYDPTSFLTIKPYLQAPPFVIDGKSSAVGSGERKATLAGPAVGILQGSAFADDIGKSWSTGGGETGTGVSLSERKKQEDVMKRVLVTPTYGVGLNLHFLEKALQVQLTYKGTASGSQDIVGWFQYNKPQEHFGFGGGFGYSHDYLFVKGQNLGTVDLQTAAYFGSKSQHQLLIGNGIYFAHTTKYPVYGGAQGRPDFVPTKASDRDFIFYKLQVEATFSVFAEHPELFQVAVGYYLDVPPKNLKYGPINAFGKNSAKYAGKELKLKHSVELTISNFI